MRANACVAAVIDTTKDGILEHDRFTKRPSASRIMRLPSGQITWSTCDLTFSQVKSGVRKLFCQEQHLRGLNLRSSAARKSYQINRSRIGRTRVKKIKLGHTTSISVLLWPMLHTTHPFFILSMCSRVTTFLLPVAVITMSTFRMTSLSFITLKPSML